MRLSLWTKRAVHGKRPTHAALPRLPCSASITHTELWQAQSVRRAMVSRKPSLKGSVTYLVSRFLKQTCKAICYG